MIRIASTNDLPALRELFARANDAPYDLPAVAEEKCFGHGIAGAPTVRLFEENGRLLGAAVSCGKWLRLLAVDREARRRGIGTALLQEEEVIAAEPGNYFTPGVFMNDEGTRAFFRARGYEETRETWNLTVSFPCHSERTRGIPNGGNEGDPSTLLPMTSQASSLSAKPAKLVQRARGLANQRRRPCRLGMTRGVRRPSHEEKDNVLTFIEAHFGRIWRFEAAKAFDRELPLAFIAEEQGAITGFVVHDVNNRGLGFFGPTGVAESMRGRGIGARLLHASLADLERLGYENVVIPWTDALDFYRKSCGAEPAHRFIAFGMLRPRES